MICSKIFNIFKYLEFRKEYISFVIAKKQKKLSIKMY
jgi:hypothetical protein